MKTINKFVVAAVIATVTSMGASKVAASPKGDDQQRPIIVASSECDVDTVHGRPMLGKGTPEDIVVCEPGTDNSDTLRGVRESSAAPKWKPELPVTSVSYTYTTRTVKDIDTPIVNEETMPEDEQLDSTAFPED